jgi:hypothetical protein
MEIALRPPSVGATPASDSAEFQRLTKAARSPRSRAGRWIGRIVAFTFCAAIGNAVTAILSASHTSRSYVLESSVALGPDEAASSSEAPRDARFVTVEMLHIDDAQVSGN